MVTSRPPCTRYDFTFYIIQRYTSHRTMWRCEEVGRYARLVLLRSSKHWPWCGVTKAEYGTWDDITKAEYDTRDDVTFYTVYPSRKTYPCQLFHHRRNPLWAAHDTTSCLNRPKPLILLLISKKQLGRTCYDSKWVREEHNGCRFIYVAWKLYNERWKRSRTLPVIDVWWYQEYYRDKTVHGDILDNLNLQSTDHKYTVPCNTRTIAVDPGRWYTKNAPCHDATGPSCKQYKTTLKTNFVFKTEFTRKSGTSEGKTVQKSLVVSFWESQQWLSFIQKRQFNLLKPSCFFTYHQV
jgi:hypothetical protein